MPRMRDFERALGEVIPLHPNVVSCLKLFVALPLVLALGHPKGFQTARALCLPLLFMIFAMLDYLDGVVAREQGLETKLGRVLDRATDLPVLLVLSALTAQDLPAAPLLLKLALDGLLLFLFARGYGSTHNRIRTTASYASLFALLLLSQHWAPRIFTPQLVTSMLWLNTGISLAIVLRRLGILRPQQWPF